MTTGTNSTICITEILPAYAQYSEQLSDEAEGNDEDASEGGSESLVRGNMRKSPSKQINKQTYTVRQIQ